MYKGYKVKVAIYAGRKATMQILKHYLKSVPYVDEIMMCVNIPKNNIFDREYVMALGNSNPKIKYYELPDYIEAQSDYSYKYFFKYFQDEDTIYIKMDDDIIYLEPGFFDVILSNRLNSKSTIIYPTIMNNPAIWLYWIRTNKVKIEGYNPDKLTDEQIMYDMLYDSKFIIPYLLNFDRDNIDFWHSDNIFLPPTLNYPLCRPSINIICFFGKTFKELNIFNRMTAAINYSDESFLTSAVFDHQKYDATIGEVIGSTVAVHYSFFSQEGMNETNILNKFLEYTKTDDR